MPSWKKVILSGSAAALSSLNVTGGITGSSILITGSAGTLFSSNVDTLILTGSMIVTGSSVITGSLKVTQGITGSLFGTASYAIQALSASWAPGTATAATASFVTSSNVYGPYGSNSILSSSFANFALTASNSQNAQDILIYVKNVTGAQIDKGKVVRISGATGDNALISTASYESDPVSANTLGITNQDIPHDSFGYVITEGTLLGINTNAFSAGQLLYLGATGSIIGTAPIAPLHAVRLGQVLRVQLNNGSMYVRIDNGYELGELHDVVDTSTTSSYGDLLVKSGSVWINSKQLTGSYGLTGSLNATSFTGSLFGTASFATTAATASFLTSNTNAFIQNGNSFGTTALLGTNDNQSLALETSGSTRMFISSSGDVGIGTASPSLLFQVGTRAGIGSDGVVYWGSALTGNNRGFLSWNTDIASVNALANLTFNTGGSFSERMRIDLSGNVGIGNTSPTVRLDVSGSVNVRSAAPRIQFDRNGSYTWNLVNGDGTTFPQSTFNIANNALTSVATFLDNGNVGIGKTTPSTRLDVSGSAIISGSFTVTPGTVREFQVRTTGVDIGNLITDTHTVTGSFSISGSLSAGISTIVANRIAASSAGANAVFTQATGSFTGAKYLYTVTSASNARTGEVMAVWNGTTVQYTDNSTLDIGSTTAVTASVSIVTAQAQFNMQTTNAGWTIKSQVTYL